MTSLLLWRDCRVTLNITTLEGSYEVQVFELYLAYNLVLPYHIAYGGRRRTGSRASC